jgi:hypothetical protein
MARGGTATAHVRAVREKSIKVLAWLSLALALAAGAMLPGTFIGSMIRTVLGWIPSFGHWHIDVVILILLILGGAAILILDPLLDMEPNRGAIWAALLLPSVTRALPGGMSDWILDLANTVLHAIDDSVLFRAAPDGAGSTALAIGTGFAALLVAKRVVRGGRV